MKTFRISSLEHSTKQQGMHPIFKLIMWMSVFLLFFTVDRVYSQGDTLRCMLSDTCSTEWDRDYYTGNMGSGITGTIWYRKRTCNGIEQIMIDSTKAIDNGQFLDSMNRYHYHYSAFSDLADVYLLQHLFNNGSTPVNPNTPRTIVQLYKASCGVWVGCEYDVDPATADCEMGFTPPLPVSGTISAPLKIYKWQPCGKVCCQKTYEIHRKQVTDNLPTPTPHWIVNIKSISITRSQFTPFCTEQYKYDKPCQDGC